MKALATRPEFDRDVERYWIEIAAHNPDAADRFLEAVRATQRALQHHPALGRLRRWSNPRLEGVRSWRVHGFRRWLVFYRETRNTLDCVRLLHGMMDLESRLIQPPE